jgi:DNA polymerase IIIc chi subunit
MLRFQTFAATFLFRRCADESPILPLSTAAVVFEWAVLWQVAQHKSNLRSAAAQQRLVVGNHVPSLAFITLRHCNLFHTHKLASCTITTKCWGLPTSQCVWSVHCSDMSQRTWSNALLQKLITRSASQEIPHRLWNPKVHYREPATIPNPEPHELSPHSPTVYLQKTF